MLKKMISIVAVAGLVSALGATASADIISNLIAHYEFENAGNPGKDTTGNYDGTGPSVDTTEAGGDPRRASVGDVTNTAGLAVPDVPTGSNYTVAMWYKNPNNSGWGSFATAGNDGQDVILLYTGTWSLGTFPAGNFRDSGYDISSTPDAWVHLGLVVTAGSAQFYIDGSPVGSTVSAVTEEITNFGDFITTGGGNAAEFLDDIRVYSRALTAGDLTEVYLVPEPASAVLLLVGLPFVMRRKRR